MSRSRGRPPLAAPEREREREREREMQRSPRQVSVKLDRTRGVLRVTGTEPSIQARPGRKTNDIISISINKH